MNDTLIVQKNKRNIFIWTYIAAEYQSGQYIVRINVLIRFIIFLSVVFLLNIIIMVFFLYLVAS